MSQQLNMTALIVDDYDKAIHFYVQQLGFELIEDTYQGAQDKRWVVVAPVGSHAHLLLAQANGDQQARVVGQQTGGRVGWFLQTDDFWRDYRSYQQNGVHFLETPREEPYGTVAVFEDLYGNRWDLIEPASE